MNIVNIDVLRNLIHSVYPFIKYQWTFRGPLYYCGHSTIFKACYTAVWKFQLFSMICIGSENEQPFGSSRNSPTWRHKEDAREERGTGNGEKWTGKWKMGNNLTWTPALSVTSFTILCFVPIFHFPISRTHSSFQGNLVTSQRSTVLCFHRHVIENKKSLNHSIQKVQNVRNERR